MPYYANALGQARAGRHPSLYQQVINKISKTAGPLYVMLEVTDFDILKALPDEEASP
jgi:hypothetical protein